MSPEDLPGDREAQASPTRVVLVGVAQGQGLVEVLEALLRDALTLVANVKYRPPFVTRLRPPDPLDPDLDFPSGQRELHGIVEDAHQTAVDGLKIRIDLEAGLVWAFVGGLVLDVLAQRPLGSSAFALLLCLGAAALLGRWFVRLRQIVPIPAAFILGVLYSMTLFVAFNALAAPIPVADPLARVLPSAVFDLVVATLIGPLAISIHDRRADVERVDW